MTPERAFEREQDILDVQLDTGVLNQAEYRKAMRELERDYRAAAEEAAREQYEREMDRWAM